MCYHQNNNNNNIYILDIYNENMRERLESKGERMTTFILDAETLNDFKSIITREGKTMKMMVEDFMKDYIKVHGDGNPAFTLDQFQDLNFMACPAFFRDPNAWDNYMKKQDGVELEKVKQQVIKIDKILGKYL